MKTVGIIQARMRSTRLPGKVVAEAAGKPLIKHMVERLRRCEALDDLVVAIPTRDYYDLRDVVRGGSRRGHAWTFCGSEEDVLSRVLLAARGHGADLVVELTADCPLIDPRVVDGVVAFFLGDGSLDFAANTIEVRDALGRGSEPTYPRGMDVRVFPRDRLEYVDSLTVDPADREHVSLYFWEHPDQFILGWVPAREALASRDRLTVDTPEDLALVRAIFEWFEEERGSNDFSLAEVLGVLDGRPDLRRLNARVEQKGVR